MATTQEDIYNQAMKERISTAPVFTGADGQQYQTARFSDNSLGTINANTGQLVTDYYDESQRDTIKNQIASGSYPGLKTTTPPVNNQQNKTQDYANLYALGTEGVQGKISQAGQELSSAVGNFNKSNIAEGIKLKTGGTKDIDTQIANLTDQYNRSYPELMRKYSHITDPSTRNQLIQNEQTQLKNQLNNLNAIREYRIGTIQDMITGEIADKEQTIKGLEAKYNLYRDVLGDVKEAEKTKKEMEKYAIEMEKSKLELEQYKTLLPYKTRETQLNLATAEEKAGLSYSEGTGQARTNRSNNPTAFTTDIAKQGGLVEGVDYTVGDSFGDKGQYNTAILLGDPIATTKKVIDNIGFKTQAGGNRWTYTDKITINGKTLNNENWKKFTDEEKTKAIEQMYQYETDPKYRDFSIFTKGTTPTSPGYIKKDTTTKSEMFKNGKINYSYVKDLNTYKELQNNTADDVSKNLTPNQINKIISEDIGNFELADEVLNDKSDFSTKASQKIKDEYILKYDIDNFKKAETENDLLSEILFIAGIEEKDIGKKTLSQQDKEYILEILKQSGKDKVLKKGKGFFNDSEVYDKLQDLGLY